jgi:hypothetical protein
MTQTLYAHMNKIKIKKKEFIVSELNIDKISDFLKVICRFDAFPFKNIKTLFWEVETDKMINNSLENAKDLK